MNGWDADQHPRHPARTAGGRGGEFRHKAGDWADRLDGLMKIQMQPAWRRGGWKDVGLDSWEADTRAMLRAIGSKYLSGVMLDAQVEEEFANTPRPRQVWENGPHRIHWWDGGKFPIGSIQLQVDRLIEDFPPPQPLRMHLVQQISNADAEAVMNSGTIRFSAAALKNSRGSGPPHFMPVSGERGVEYWHYVLAHEWGHLLDAEGEMLARGSGSAEATRFVSRGRAVLRDKVRDSLSDYGRGEDTEGVAESFAEWYLTNGKTTNAAAQAYADYYLWWGKDGRLRRD